MVRDFASKRRILNYQTLEVNMPNTVSAFVILAYDSTMLYFYDTCGCTIGKVLYSMAQTQAGW